MTLKPNEKCKNKEIKKKKNITLKEPTAELLKLQKLKKLQVKKKEKTADRGHMSEIIKGVK